MMRLSDFNPWTKPSTRSVKLRERGQILPLALLMMGTMFCVTGFAVDVGRVFIAYQTLVASTDSAALAGGQALAAQNSTATSVTSAVDQFGSMTGNDNVSANAPSASTNTPTLLCLNSINIGCYGAGSYNALSVTQTASLPMTFGQFFGMSSVSLSATSTAAMAGAPPVPYNVAIILDATLSQTALDSDCGSNVTEMYCEEQGVQILLKDLYPCALTSTLTCTITNGVSANAVDQVALFTFPALTTASVSVNTNCTSPITAAGAAKFGYPNQSPYGYFTMENETAWPTIATAAPYTFPTVGATSYSPTGTTYQVTPFLSDYRTSDSTTTLNPNSDLVQALGGDSGCGGMLPPNYDGDMGTYYAGVIYAAQSALIAQQAAHPGTENVIILLSDGNATAPQSETYNGFTVNTMGTAGSNGTYPSYHDECAQAVTAAHWAATSSANNPAPSRVYAIAYGAESSGCSADNPRISPCNTMKGIASSAGYFFSDYTQSGSGIDTGCVGTGATASNLNTIFGDIYVSLGVARLIPNGTT
jgi:hypothetical protein